MWNSVFWLPIVFLGILGATIGSFLNVVIYRSLDKIPQKKKESWVTGRSRCDNCGELIAWYDNIPLLSFIILKGKCRTCHQPISSSHVVVEILTAALFVWWYLVGSVVFFKLGEMPFQIIQPLYWLVVGILLLFILMADLRYFIIPDTAVLLLTLATVIYQATLVGFGIMRTQDFAWSMAAALVVMLGFGFLWLITRGRGLGFGDVKLIFPLSLIVGWPVTIPMVMGAFVLGAVVGLVLIGSGKHRWKQPLPFGPFLIVSTCINLLWGHALVGWYLGYLL